MEVRNPILVLDQLITGHMALGIPPLCGPQFPTVVYKKRRLGKSFSEIPTSSTFQKFTNKEDSVSSNGDVRLTRPLIKASGLTPVLTGLKWSHFSRFLSMDISVATFPFLVFTVKSLEQFPYTVSYGSRRYNRQIQRGKTFLGALERTGKGAGRKGRSDMDLEGPSSSQAERGHCRRLASQRCGEDTGKGVLIPRHSGLAA